MVKSSWKYISLVLLLYGTALLGMFVAHIQMNELRGYYQVEQTFDYTVHQEMQSSTSEWLVDNPYHSHDFHLKNQELEKTYNFYWLSFLCEKITITIENCMRTFFEWIF